MRRVVFNEAEEEGRLAARISSGIARQRLLEARPPLLSAPAAQLLGVLADGAVFLLPDRAHLFNEAQLALAHGVFQSVAELLFFLGRIFQRLGVEEGGFLG